MWFVYILECKDGTFYTGITKNLKKRLLAHKNGKGGHYTKSHKPLKIIYREEFLTKSDALKREYEIKKLKRAEKRSLTPIKSGLTIQS